MPALQWLTIGAQYQERGDDNNGGNKKKLTDQKSGFHNQKTEHLPISRQFWHVNQVEDFQLFGNRRECINNNNTITTIYLCQPFLFVLQGMANPSHPWMASEPISTSATYRNALLAIFATTKPMWEATNSATGKVSMAHQARTRRNGVTNSDVFNKEISK